MSRANVLKIPVTFLVGNYPSDRHVVNDTDHAVLYNLGLALIPC